MVVGKTKAMATGKVTVTKSISRAKLFDLDTYITRTPNPIVGIFGPEPCTDIIQHIVKRIGKRERIIVACRQAETAARYNKEDNFETYVVSTIQEVDTLWQTHSGPLAFQWQHEIMKERKDRMTIQQIESENTSSLLLILEDNFLGATGSACIQEILSERNRYRCSLIYTCCKTRLAKEFSSRSKTDVMLLTRNIPLRSLYAFVKWTIDNVPETYKSIFSNVSNDKKCLVIHQGLLGKYKM